MKFKIPSSTSRAVFVGKTGCGKTTLAKGILPLYKNVIVLDNKGMMKESDWKGFTVFKDFDSLIKADDKTCPKRIFQPDIFNQSLELFDSFFKWIYHRQNTVVYIDEVYSICESSRQIPFYYKGILTRGRERGIACFSATQRPMDIPNVILSESEFYFVFQLRLDADREKVEKITGIRREYQAELEDFEFFIANDKQFSLQKRKLKI